MGNKINKTVKNKKSHRYFQFRISCVCGSENRENSDAENFRCLRVIQKIAVTRLSSF